MGFRNLGESTSKVIVDASAVYKMRAGIYQRKIEIIKTPMVRDIVHAICNDSEHPPINLTIAKEGILARVYDKESGTYHPNGVIVYQPEVIFDYEIAVAILLILQDLYPKVYILPTATATQIAEEINAGTWSLMMNMNREYIGRTVPPAFDIDNIADVPLDQLPIEIKDSQEKKYAKLPVIAIALSVLSLFVPTILQLLFAVAAMIVGAIGFNTGHKRVLSMGAIILAILGLALPIIVKIFF